MEGTSGLGAAPSTAGPRGRLAGLPGRVLDRLEEVLIAGLMAGATVLIFVSVLHRYGLGLTVAVEAAGQRRGWGWLEAGAHGLYDWLSGFSLTWAQELCIYMFVWMAKFGAAYGVRTGIHVGVDVLVNRLDPRYRYLLVLFALLCGALFTGVIGTLGGRFVWELSDTDQTSADLEWPMWVVYLCVPLGSGLMCFRFLQVAWRFARTGDLPHHDHGAVEGVEAGVDSVPDLHPQPLPAAR